MKIRQNKLHRLALSTLSSLLILSAANSYADDTEIFFGGPAIDDSVRPNVLFILDNSGSMAWRTDSNSSPSGSEKSRMQILKESFSTIINNAGAINAGIMVLNERSAYNNTRMVYPVSNIDAPLPSSVQQVASTPQILVSGDDATQSSLVSTAVIGDTSLVMGNISTPILVGTTNTNTLRNDGSYFLTSTGYACANNPATLTPPAGRPSVNCPTGVITTSNLRNSSAGKTSLFHFRGLSQPANYTITSAYLELVPTNSQNSNKPTLNIRIERSKTPAALDDSGLLSPAGNPRNFITGSATASSWTNGAPARVDITSMLLDLQNDDANPIGDLLLSFRATSSTRDYIFNAQGATSSLMPRIVVNYQQPSTQIESRTGGLRFQNVGIPQGATVQSAYLSFAPAASNSDPIRFDVQAEKVADAATFTNSTNMTARVKTTAVTGWDAPAWINDSPPEHVQGPDVKAQVQEVVNLAGWCGNNSMAFYLDPTSGSGSRTAHSIDGAPGLQPTLTVTYTGGSGGCLNPIIEASVIDPKNDAYEDSNGNMSLGANTLPVTTTSFAARYEGVPIRQGATILDAQVILTPANTIANPTVNSNVRFENTDNSVPMTATSNNISNRSDTADNYCTINNWVAGTPFTCSQSGIKTGLQSVINRAGWAPGNALLVSLRQGSASSLLAQAYETNPAQSVKLRIKIASGGLASSTYTVRQHLNALVQSMNASGVTPIVPTYYETAQYLRGERSGYASPIISACQTTHVVLLTDGQANGSSSASQSGIGTWAGSCTGDASATSEQCGRTLATWLGDTDQSGFDGDNFITTHTIGFALGALAPNTAPQTFLDDLAANGEGSAYTADNASELSQAFSQILQNVLSTDTTFVSPGAAVNQFNRRSNKNEVYFALFKPSETNRWVGNLKRYALNSGSGDIILDADNVGAVDSTTGFFKSSARSFWSNPADGNNTALGGVASQLPAAASRKAFTYIGTSPATPANLNSATNRLEDANAAITTGLLGAADATERTELINWIRGLNTDGSARKAVGDPLHSIPRLVTYECTEFTDSSLTQCKTEDQSAFVGTNEGFVHAFDTNTGAEQLAFMPQELLSNIKDLKANARSTSLAPRKYGMDNTVAVWVNDANRNGVIYGGRDPSSTSSPPASLSGLNSGEFVYAYATMGRGGRSLYALDVTNRDNPKMLWFKDSSSAGFSRLGQTWSTPVVTKIDVNGTETPVLMFTGGYDDNQDDVNARTADVMGNAIYIVNAKTGALIWSASSASGHTQQLNKMLYSMPSSLRVIDIDRDGLADQFFATDMGGQVWRFFINNGNAASSLVSPLDSGSGSTADGVFASVIPADTGSETPAQLESKLRRFYNEPSVALLTVAGSKTLAVSVGSGYRGHPLDTGTEDRFYSFRTPILYSNAAHTILTESNLYDATNNLIQGGSAAEKAAAASAFASSPGGWYIRLNDDGEKVLSDAITFSGKLFFNTYEPTAASNSCQAVLGIGRAYAVNLYDATPAAQNADGTPGSRFSLLKTGGIPPEPIVLFPDAGSGQSKKPVVCTGTKCTEESSVPPGSSYWIDES
ncbi:pilus assembly protein [Pseudomonas sp. 2FG]|uniref:pilus assembly protein n=1 Tax=Pseudomonas sp. 2FG TaxID=2502191 RepID=UPI0010F629E6|nr:PilC/PilY family type IV pilus protein [Pseudomonas sp. 2FG]